MNELLALLILFCTAMGLLFGGLGIYELGYIRGLRDGAQHNNGQEG